MRRIGAGFTLIELLIVTAIIGVISSFVALNILGGARAKARDSIRKANLKQIESALQAYYLDHNLQYPPDPAVNSGTEFTSETGASTWLPDLAPNYLKTMPVDPKQAGLITQLAFLIQGFFGQGEFPEVAVAGLFDTGSESFETLPFPPTGWTTGGNANWIQSSFEAQDGTQSAESGIIGHTNLLVESKLRV
ncbi:type II secretion system protein [Candidatus Curtissbacteria bacterium]|nr:type II secretion system protein [Candidatus Curtissbacteria bacterium]